MARREEPLRYGNDISLYVYDSGGYVSAGGFIDHRLWIDTLRNGIWFPPNAADCRFKLCIRRKYTAQENLTQFIRDHGPEYTVNTIDAFEVFLTKLKRTTELATLSKLRQDVEAERRAAIDANRGAMGSQLFYGSQVQLLHVSSQKYVTMYMKVSDFDRKAMKVTVDQEGSSGSWFKVLPGYKTTKEGDPVNENDTVLLENVTYPGHFLNTHVIVMAAGTALLDSWKARTLPYMTYVELPVEVNCSKGYFAKITMVPGSRPLRHPGMSSLLTGGRHVYLFQQNVDSFLVYDSDQILLRAPKKKTADALKNTNAVWYLEFTDMHGVGDPVESATQEVRIRHLPTGKFLCAAPTPEGETGLTMTSAYTDPNALWKFSQFADPYSKGHIDMGSLVYIQNSVTMTYLTHGNMMDVTLPSEPQNIGRKKFTAVQLDSRLEPRNAFVVMPAENSHTAAITWARRVIGAINLNFLAKVNSLDDGGEPIKLRAPVREYGKELESFLTDLIFKLVDSTTLDPLTRDGIPVKFYQKLCREQGVLDTIAQLIEAPFKKGLKVEDVWRMSNTHYPSLLRVLQLAYRALVVSCKGYEKNMMYLARYIPLYQSHLGSDMRSAVLLTALFTNNRPLLTAVDDQVLKKFVDLLEHARMARFSDFLSKTLVANGDPIPQNQNRLVDIFIKEKPKLLLETKIEVVQGKVVLYLRDQLVEDSQFWQINGFQAEEDEIIASPNEQNPRQMLFMYHISTLQLCASLCLGRNNYATAALCELPNNSFKYSELIQIAAADGVPFSVRAAYLELLKRLYLDREPRKVMPAIQFIRIPHDIHVSKPEPRVKNDPFAHIPDWRPSDDFHEVIGLSMDWFNTKTPIMMGAHSRNKYTRVLLELIIMIADFGLLNPPKGDLPKDSLAGRTVNPILNLLECGLSNSLSVHFVDNETTRSFVEVKHEALKYLWILYDMRVNVRIDIVFDTYYSVYAKHQMMKKLKQEAESEARRKKKEAKLNIEKTEKTPSEVVASQQKAEGQKPGMKLSKTKSIKPAQAAVLATTGLKKDDIEEGENKYLAEATGDHYKAPQARSRALLSAKSSLYDEEVTAVEDDDLFGNDGGLDVLAEEDEDDDDVPKPPALPGNFVDDIDDSDDDAPPPPKKAAPPPPRKKEVAPPEPRTPGVVEVAAVMQEGDGQNVVEGGSGSERRVSYDSSLWKFREEIRDAFDDGVAELGDDEIIDKMVTAFPDLRRVVEMETFEGGGDEITAPTTARTDASSTPVTARGKGEGKDRHARRLSATLSRIYSQGKIPETEMFWQDNTLYNLCKEIFETPTLHPKLELGGAIVGILLKLMRYHYKPFVAYVLKLLFRHMQQRIQLAKAITKVQILAFEEDVENYYLALLDVEDIRRELKWILGNDVEKKETAYALTMVRITSLTELINLENMNESFVHLYQNMMRNIGAHTNIIRILHLPLVRDGLKARDDRLRELFQVCYNFLEKFNQNNEENQLACLPELTFFATHMGTEKLNAANCITSIVRNNPKVNIEESVVDRFRHLIVTIGKNVRWLRFFDALVENKSGPVAKMQDHVLRVILQEGDAMMDLTGERIDDDGNHVSLGEHISSMDYRKPMGSVVVYHVTCVKLLAKCAKGQNEGNQGILLSISGVAETLRRINVVYNDPCDNIDALRFVIGGWLDWLTYVLVENKDSSIVQDLRDPDVGIIGLSQEMEQSDAISLFEIFATDFDDILTRITSWETEDPHDRSLHAAYLAHSVAPLVKSYVKIHLPHVKRLSDEHRALVGRLQESVEDLLDLPDDRLKLAFTGTQQLSLVNMVEVLQNFTEGTDLREIDPAIFKNPSMSDDPLVNTWPIFTKELAKAFGVKDFKRMIGAGMKNTAILLGERQHATSVLKMVQTLMGYTQSERDLVLFGLRVLRCCVYVMQSTKPDIRDKNFDLFVQTKPPKVENPNTLRRCQITYTLLGSMYFAIDRITRSGNDQEMILAGIRLAATLTESGNRTVQDAVHRFINNPRGEPLFKKISELLSASINDLDERTVWIRRIIEHMKKQGRREGARKMVEYALDVYENDERPPIDVPLVCGHLSITLTLLRNLTSGSHTKMQDLLRTQKRSNIQYNILKEIVRTFDKLEDDLLSAIAVHDMYILEMNELAAQTIGSMLSRGSKANKKALLLDTPFLDIANRLMSKCAFNPEDPRDILDKKLSIQTTIVSIFSDLIAVAPESAIIDELAGQLDWASLYEVMKTSFLIHLRKHAIVIPKNEVKSFGVQIYHLATQSALFMKKFSILELPAMMETESCIAAACGLPMRHNELCLRHVFTSDEVIDAVLRKYVGHVEIVMDSGEVEEEYFIMPKTYVDVQNNTRLRKALKKIREGIKHDNPDKKAANYLAIMDMLLYTVNRHHYIRKSYLHRGCSCLSPIFGCLLFIVTLWINILLINLAQGVKLTGHMLVDEAIRVEDDFLSEYYTGVPYGFGVLALLDFWHAGHVQFWLVVIMGVLWLFLDGSPRAFQVRRTRLQFVKNVTKKVKSMVPSKVREMLPEKRQSAAVAPEKQEEDALEMDKAEEEAALGGGGMSRNQKSIEIVDVLNTSGSIDEDVVRASGSVSNAMIEKKEMYDNIQAGEQSRVWLLLAREPYFFVIYLTVSFLGIWYHPLFFTIYGLAIFKIAYVRLVVTSILFYWRQQLAVLLIALMILYGYAIVAFSIFEENNRMNDCSTFFSCCLAFLEKGLYRSNLSTLVITDDIPSTLVDVLSSYDTFWSEAVRLFGASFSTIFIFFVQIAFTSLIVVSMNRYRTNMENEKSYWRNYCYICDLGRRQWEDVEGSFEEHINHEHNPYHLLAFLVKAESKPRGARSAIEEQVIDEYKKNSALFIPTRRSRGLDRHRHIFYSRRSAGAMQKRMTTQNQLIEKRLNSVASGIESLTKTVSDLSGRLAKVAAETEAVKQ